MPATNLSLGKCGYATGVNSSTSSSTSLQDCAGTSGSAINLTDFLVGSCAGPLVPDDTPNENTSATVTFLFGDPGTRFSRISSQTRNFTGQEQGFNTPYFTLTTTADSTAPIQYGAVTSNTVGQIRSRFADQFNLTAASYNSGIYESFTIQNTGGGRR